MSINDLILQSSVDSHATVRFVAMAIRARSRDRTGTDGSNYLGGLLLAKAELHFSHETIKLTG